MFPPMSTVYTLCALLNNNIVHVVCYVPIIAVVSSGEWLLREQRVMNRVIGDRGFFQSTSPVRIKCVDY